IKTYLFCLYIYSSCSFDTRGPHVNSPSHWKDVAILEDRANFKTTREQSRAVLVISPVQKKDAGNFRCRVDFLLSPTKNSNVNLEIVVFCLPQPKGFDSFQQQQSTQRFDF
uniref:Ig domain-containing protein n=1 Tax=Anopheles christyi TaxID=43041 RepID=A0A182K4G3_9DIPT